MKLFTVLFTSAMLVFPIPMFCVANETALPVMSSVEKASFPVHREVAAVSVRLSGEGKALLPIRIAANATPRVRTAARTLAAYLKQMSGVEFVVETARSFSVDGQGIMVGLFSEFETLPGAPQNVNREYGEEYILRSHAGGVVVAGASELGVENAVWDMLYRLGYRQFFPGDKWEIVPRQANLQLTVDAVESPDYLVRNVWFGAGGPPEHRQKYEVWKARNREASGIILITTHSYEGIIHRNKAEFEAHPEYLALVDGVRATDKGELTKFCIANPGLRALVVADALRQFEENPALQSISMDPSDGSNWCQCLECAKIGSVTDRVVTLANTVAVAVEKQYPGKYIGMYAYHEHSPPPSIEVHPNVIVSIATSFIRGGYTVEQLLEGWHKKAKTLGIREYYGVYSWDRGLPGQSRGSDPSYLQTTTPGFNASGVRFMSSESTYGWGQNGLGYYLASRLLWDTGEATRVDELIEDFLEKAFGTAKEPMREWYRLNDGSRKPLVSSDLVGRMYRQIEAALKLADVPAIRARLIDLALYTRYVDLYGKYAAATGAERQKAFEELLRFAFDIRTTQMTYTTAIWRVLPKRDTQIKFSEAAFPFLKDANTPVQGEPFTAAEIEEMVRDGIARHPLLGFEAVSYSTDLKPATELPLTSGQPGTFHYLRGNANLYTWVDVPGTIPLQMRAGLIYATRGDARLTLYPEEETLEQSVGSVAVIPDKTARGVELKTPFRGLQRIEFADGTGGTEIRWREDMPMAIECSLTNPAPVFTKWSLYFYVPKGTRVVGGYGEGKTRILDGSGALVKELAQSKDYWSVPVPPGQDGKLWKFDNADGQFMLMTVPPYLARSAAELLLPAEVIKADAR